MSQPTVFQQSYLGMRRDVSRDQLPAGYVWNTVDFLPRVLGSRLRKRGGWGYASGDIRLTNPGALSIRAVAFAEFSTGSQLVAVDQAGNLYRIDESTGAVTQVDAGTLVYVPLQKPVLHRDKLIFPDPAGVAGPKAYGGTTITVLRATAPAGKYACVYKDRTYLAAGTKLWAGPPGDPSAADWDTTNAFFNLPYDVAGIWAMKNAILVFYKEATERITGSSPPPDVEMTRGPLFDMGLIDARSLAAYGDNLVFVNEQGVWLTDGSTAENLLEAGGMLSYWFDEIAGDITDAYTFAGGIDRGAYWLTVMNGATFVDCLVCQLNSRTWFRVSNLPSVMYAPAYGTAYEMFFASRSEARVGRLSPLFSPTSANERDADGAAVEPIVETGFFSGNPGLKRWLNVYAGYQLTRGTRHPVLTLSYATSPTTEVYIPVTEKLGSVAGMVRVKRPIRRQIDGIALKLQQTGPSADTVIADLEADVFSREKSFVGG